MSSISSAHLRAEKRKTHYEIPEIFEELRTMSDSHRMPQRSGTTRPRNSRTHKAREEPINSSPWFGPSMSRSNSPITVFPMDSVPTTCWRTLLRDATAPCSGNQ